MPTAFYHRPHHARVVFDGKLNWASAVDLVETLDTVVETYHYDAVELIVTSPGGDTDALAHVLTSLRERQANGVMFQTRVVSYAASAAAVLATAGGFRTAAEGAKLLFHSVRLGGEEAMTARVARAVAAQVERIDGVLVGNMVGGVLLAAPCPPPAATAQPSDRPVLEALWPVVSPKRRARRPRALKALVEATSAYVGRAVAAEDIGALQRLYRRLLPVETPISADLARALGLVDWVGPAPSRVPAQADEPGIVVPEWHALFPDGLVPRSVLTRHILALGETGSGKTRSVVLPVAAALAREDSHTVGAALVIDPKGELGPVLGAVAPERLRELRTDSLALDIMAGPRWSLDADLAAGRWLSAAHKVLMRTASLVPASPARVLLPHASDGDPTGEFFDREGTALAQCVLALVLYVLARPEAYAHLIGDDRDRAPAGDDVHVAAWADAFADLSEVSIWLGQLRARAQAGFNAVALTHWALTSPLLNRQCPGGSLLSLVVNSVVPAGDDPVDEGQVLRERVTSYWQRMSAITRQFAATLGAAVNATVDWAVPAVASSLYIGCEPGFLQSMHRVDFAEVVSPRPSAGPRPFLLFQPARDDLDRLVAVCLKASLFEAVLDDPDRARGGADLPLCAYVADEFHRYGTSDPVHGEQSYLDTCRSYGGVCVLATHSLASLTYAFAQRASCPTVTDAAMSMIWTNTATKVVFRSTDRDTLSRVSQLCPHTPGLASLVEIRPLSNLGVGQCYAALADGRFERCCLAPYAGVEAAREMRAARLLPTPEAGVGARACEDGEVGR